MTTYTLTVVGPMVNRRGKPPKPGWLNANDRHAHWAARHKLTAEWRNRAFQAATAAGIPRLDRVHILATFVLPNARRRDPANLYPSVKACVDGITDRTEALAGGGRIQVRGILPDDDSKHVEGPDMRMRIDRGLAWPVIELTITDLGGENA